ncbi:hypothetical protein [Marispirochaeta sp.]|uniref:hypothetical protein n=1 Tax=Marispirochaeta sp. TaxID=2038653 RepID=UPI0029C66A5E|nr:hypothetical protein [Marispirochaeta sp.]
MAILRLRLFVCALIFLVAVGTLTAQSSEDGMLDPSVYLKLTGYDIATADLYQLQDWCRILAIDHRGTIDTLRRRLYDHFEYDPDDIPDMQAGEETQTITIRSADSTRYFTLETNQEGYIEISGGILLELYSPVEGTRHTITADRLLYNQSTGDLSAKGTVRYTLVEEGNQEETFFGESLTVNLGNWESRFLEGYTLQNRTINEKELTFSFYGDTIARSSSEIIFMQDGRITSSTMDPPSYHINADELWVYEPGEWLMNGATFYLGRVPILIFPFFFQLRDKMVVNPSFGFDLVDGAFIQTTTYLYGMPSKSDQDSLSFLQMTDVEEGDRVTERRGLYMRTMENPSSEEVREARRLRESGDYFRLILDYYNRKGLVSALDLSLSDVGSLDSLELFAGAGVTRVVSEYSPYQYTWEDPEKSSPVSIWEGGWIGGVFIPFRFDFRTALEGELNGLNYSLSLPFNSDPRVSRLFDNRKETIDWGELLAITEDPDPYASTSLPSGFTWEAGSGYSADTTGLRPWITEFRIRELSSSMEWAYGKVPASEPDLDSLLPYYSIVPSYLRSEYSSVYFPYPKSLVLPKLRINMAGNLYTGVSKEDAAAGSAAGEMEELLPPWRSSEEETAPVAEDDSGLLDPRLIDDYTLTLNADSARNSSLSYSFNPTLVHGISYDIYGWKEGENAVYSSPEEVDFDSAYSLTTFSGDARLRYDGSYVNNIVSLNESLSLTFQEKQRTRNIESTIPNWDSLVESDKGGSYERLSHSMTLSTRPFLHSAVPVDQTIEYRLQHYLFTREYESGDGFRNNVLPWERNTIQEQRISSTSLFNVWDYPQKVYVTGVLPPLLGDIDAVYTGEFNRLQMSLSGGATEIDDGIWEPDDLISEARFNLNEYSYLRQRFLFGEDEEREDFRLREGISEATAATANNRYGLLSSYEYSIQEEDDSGNEEIILPQTLMFKGWIGNFWSRYALEYLYPYDLDIGSGWTRGSEREFIPSTFSLGYKRNFEPEPFWKRRVNMGFGINTGLTQDLNRFSDSSLFFETSLTLKVFQFLDLQFSSYSENTSVFRYMPWLLEDSGIRPINPLEDLISSLNFFNEEERRISNFNLQSIALKAVHHLDQWDLTLEYTGEPEQESEGARPIYRWQSSFSIYLQWNPIPELEQELVYSDGDLSL